MPAAQLVACVGLGYAYVTIKELWYMPNTANLGTYSLDGFGVSIVALAAASIVGLTRPKLAVTATAVAGGIGLFFLAWGYFALGNDSMKSEPAFRDAWRVFLYVGLAVAVLTVVDLARRRMLEGPVGWQRPSWRRSALLVVGTVLAIAAIALDINDQAVWTFSDAVVVVPFVAVTLTWVAVTVPMTATGAARAAAVAFLSASTLAALYLGVNASSAFAAATALGDVCLLVAVILASRRRSTAGSVGPAAVPPLP